MSADLETRTYLDAAQLADYLNRPSAEAARKWAKRAGVRIFYAGKKLMVLRREVDQALAGKLTHRVRKGAAQPMGSCAA